MRHESGIRAHTPKCHRRSCTTGALAPWSWTSKPPDRLDDPGGIPNGTESTWDDLGIASWNRHVGDAIAAPGSSNQKLGLELVPRTGGLDVRGNGSPHCAKPALRIGHRLPDTSRDRR